MGKAIVIDSVMGSGKTSWAIQHMNEAPAERKFIFITPYLDEIGRIKKDVVGRDFVSPDNDNEHGRKLYDLKQLITSGADIATTHSLFQTADDELIDLLATDGGYTLILDEVMGVVEKVEIGKDDITTLIDAELIRIESDNRVSWIRDSYLDGNFTYIKRLAKAGNLFYHRDRFLVRTFPPKVFNAFDSVYVMTYLFHGQAQRYYYDLNGIEYEYRAIRKSEDRFQLVEYDSKAEGRRELYGLIEVYDGKLNEVGARTNALSASWLSNSKPDVKKRIKDNLYNYFHNICGASKSDVIWTTLRAVYNDRKSGIRPRRYSNDECFVSLNMRATNRYADRWALGYAYNRYMDQHTRAYFEDNGVSVDQDMYAVSDLLQWVWRSRIRNGEPVNLYLPSSRMRTLLQAWSNYEI